MSTPVTDRAAATTSGYNALFAFIVLLILGIFLIGSGIAGAETNPAPSGMKIIGGIISLIAAALAGLGIYILQPNQSAVLTLFGDYRGTDDQTGLRWTNPFTRKTKVSRRLQTHLIKAIKVNDAYGNPIEIGAAIVWHVKDSAKAVLEVGQYNDFVDIQSESALRKIASSHPYDNWAEKSDDARPGQDQLEISPFSLRESGEQVTDELQTELRNRLERAGLEVIEARITHLAYAPEIASSMLRRQQASAVIAARRTIVKGAVDLVTEALQGLKDKDFEIDSERQMAMISNLLVVLVGDKDTSPVINTGTLYS
jgi:regulator of protease activity HflC (stomatin/prohibitin superfamily)